MPSLEAWQWVLGALCAAGVGVAKTGVPGFGILAIPLMVFVVGDARASAGWLLPILCVADIFAIVYYRRHVQARRLFGLAPWVIGGMTVGWLALGLRDDVLRPIVGTIVLFMVAAHVWRKRRGARIVGGAVHSAAFGTVAGFATMVANAAGPVMNVYLLSKRLPKEEFVAAGAWFFFLVNLSKLPFYGVRGMITAPSLVYDLCMLPLVAGGAVLGRVAIKRLPQGIFEVAVLGLTTGAAVLLFR